jgi:hypothetical protein
MEKKETENKRYICLVRASDTSEGTTSTEAQLTYLNEYGQRMGMVYVDQVPCLASVKIYWACWIGNGSRMILTSY